jgi:hypothetical protein
MVENTPPSNTFFSSSFPPTLHFRTEKKVAFYESAEEGRRKAEEKDREEGLRKGGERTQGVYYDMNAFVVELVDTQVLGTCARA